MEDLLAVFISCVSRSNRVFPILDALDECHERDELLDIINRAVLGNVRLLVTSRREQDTAENLDNWIEAIVKVEDFLIDDDIRHHVQNFLERDKRLSRWPPSIKQEIEVALTNGNHGM